MWYWTIIKYIILINYHSNKSLSELREKVAGVDASLLEICPPVLLLAGREADVELVAFADQTQAVFGGRWLVEETWVLLEVGVLVEIGLYGRVVDYFWYLVDWQPPFLLDDLAEGKSAVHLQAIRGDEDEELRNGSVCFVHLNTLALPQSFHCLPQGLLVVDLGNCYSFHFIKVFS